MAQSLLFLSCWTTITRLREVFVTLVKRLKILFPDEHVSAIGELYEDEAPTTCQALWRLLPMKTTALHDIWSGHVVQFFLDPPVIVNYENVPRLLDVNPGDLYYYYRSPHFFRGAPYGKTESSEIGIVYDRDSQPWGPRGAKAVNLFGKITENIQIVRDICERMITEGAKTISLEKVE